MEDKNTKRSSDIENNSDSLKKSRSTFFRVEMEQEIDAIKRELAEKTTEPFRVALKESSEIFSLLTDSVNRFEKVFYEAPQDEQDCLFEMEQDDLEDGSDEKLADYERKISFFMEYSQILMRVTPFCDFVDRELLKPVLQALNKIREICGCDLNDVSTWGVAQPYTNKLCEIADDFGDRKFILRDKKNYLLEEMEAFISVYQDATDEERDGFRTKLAQDNNRMIWLHPWIEIAEKRNKPYLEEALLESVKIFPVCEGLQARKGI